MNYRKPLKTRFEPLTNDQVMKLLAQLQNERRETGVTRQELRIAEILLRANSGVSYDDLFDTLYLNRTQLPSSRSVIRVYVSKLREHLAKSKTGVQIHVDWTNEAREIGLVARPWPDPKQAGAAQPPVQDGVTA